MSKTISQALAEFDEKFVMEAVNRHLESGNDPIMLVKELQQGMNMVGERFDRGRYFLSELIMSADLFTRVMALIEPSLEGRAMEKIGRMVIGTPKGDIHDLGKNIFCTVMKGAGFEVLDLGIDVPVERFLEAVEEHQPQILGFSALLTTTFDVMKTIVDRLIEKDLRSQLKIIVGGGVTTDTVLKYVGADAQTVDALEGLKLCKGFITL
jgi:methanogenic corrinoid protein MtbC1